MSREWRHRAEYGLVRTLEGLISMLPETAADRLGTGFGMLAHAPLGIRRSTVVSNIRTAFRDAPPEWVEQVARDTYRHLGREAVAMLRLSRLDAAEIRARTVMRGWEDIQEGLAEGRGALLVTGHFGNWEIAAAAAASRGLHIEAIAKRQRNRRFDRRLDALRRRLGVETMGQGEAIRRVPRVLKDGHVVGIVADQDARSSGVWVPFFGRPTSAYRGPALFALRFGAPLFACTARRLPGAEPRYEVTAERVEITRTGDLEADTLRLTGEVAARLEAAVRRAPEQYFWFHKRWKTQPPEELNSVRVSNI